jgi:hypothetical protein
MKSFCTVFDKYYLYQAVALYLSLKRVSIDFKLYALCLDDISYHIILELNISNLIPVSLDRIMNEEVRGLRERTTYPQFCWACQPLICEYILDEYKFEMITYLEADSLFFSNPNVLFEEMGDKSVTLASHNFPEGEDQSATAGKYITHFNAFKNDECGRKVLNEWKNNCFLYSNDNPPHFRPGQLLMDDWPDKFDCIHVLKNIGAGVAPWNVESRDLKLLENKLYFGGTPVVFYHFHKYARTVDGKHNLGDYKISSNTIKLVYKEYVKSINKAKYLVLSANSSFDYMRMVEDPVTLKNLMLSFTLSNLLGYLRKIKLLLTGRYNYITNNILH